MSIDYDALSLQQMIELQEEIAREVTSRFERQLALVFSDVVGSTRYFEKFGAAAGRGLVQRHEKMLRGTVSSLQGRVVDLAGDGGFCCFPSAVMAATAMIELFNTVAIDNTNFDREHRLSLRAGIHLGSVLTDGVIVTGEGVNLAARISTAAKPDEIRLSPQAVMSLPPALRVRCRTRDPVSLKGIAEPLELWSLEWRDPTLFPTRVRIVETDQIHDLPSSETIRFGRLSLHQGAMANDVVLTHPDPTLSNRISRWHFELRRTASGYRLLPVSKAPTAVDGTEVKPGQEVAVKPGSVVSVSHVLTLELLSDGGGGGEATIGI